MSSRYVSPLVFVFLLLLAIASPARAQSSSPAPQAVTLYELALRDGSRLYGTITSESPIEVVFKTQVGTIVTVPRGDILSLKRISGVMMGAEFAPADPNATRMFFGPTGRSLQRGQVYFGVYEFLLPFVQVGITDRISIGGGTPLVFGQGTADRPYWITPKVQVIRGASNQVSVGMFHGFSPDDGGAGIAYVVGTHGSSASSFTVGGGLGYESGGGRAGVLMVGAERQFSRSMKVITENYVWKGGDGIVSGGVRFFGERLSADVGLVLPLTTDAFILLPLVNFVYLFRRQRGSAMQVMDTPRRTLSSRQFAWLEAESRLWRDSGAIGEDARRIILDRYEVVSAERRGMIAMILVAITMCSVGLLLLIGYNWDQIPRAAKLTLVIGAVAAAFAAAAIAYARDRAAVGETLVFFGVLLYGNAIWLVAQILNIQGRYPDAFLWWALGALACAALVRSAWLGIGSAALVLFWVFVEGTFTGRPDYAFLAVWPLALATAYALRSPMMLSIAATSLPLWMFVGGMAASHSAFWNAGIALSACAVYGAGRWHRDDDPMGDAWEASGLFTLLLAFIPLLITYVHRELKPGDASVVAVTIAIVAGIVALAPAWRRARAVTDHAVVAVAAATLVWAIASWSGKLGSGGGFAIAATVLFSILCLVMSLSLVRTALATGEVSELRAGIAFALLFLIVRWASVIENLLWSGVLMLAAGGGLLLVARLWRKRPRPQVEGRAS